MNQQIRLCNITELPPEGEAREFSAAGKPICLATINGKTTALDNVCPHRGASLSEGNFEGGKLICPWHGWTFSMTDGSAEGMPGEHVDLYPIEISGGHVFIELPETSGHPDVSKK